MKSFLRKTILILFVLLLLGPLSWAQSFPSRAQGHVNDFARVLSSRQRDQIEAICLQLSQKIGAQLAVVTVPSVRPQTIEQYAVQLFQQWGIGQAGKDNGILFLTAVNDREVRIEVGYGLEGTLTDAVTRSIIERFIIPAFRQGSYAQGIEAGTLAIVSLVGQAQGVTITGQEQKVYQAVHHEDSQGFNVFSLIIFIILIILFIKNPRLFLFFMMMSMMGGGRRGSGYGGSFGGGFGGFGGGMSGGGGASGRW